MSNPGQADNEKALALATVSNFHEYFSQPVPLTEGSRYTLPRALSVVSLPAELGGLKIETFSEMYERVSQFLAKSYESGMKGFGHKLAAPEGEVWVSGQFAAVLVGWSAHMEGRGEFVHSINLCTLHRLPNESSTDANPWRIAGLVDMEHQPPGTPVPQVETGPVSEIIAPFETLLAHIKAGNWEAITPLLLPGAGATISKESQIPDTLRWPDFVRRLQAEAESGPVAEKKLLNSEARRCGNLAFVWAPFVLEVDGREQAQGVNVCSFKLEEGQWLISGLWETSSTE
ncbi:hypothetical protein FSARC_10943 [Fusarium sarcochroum]|uniref:SnoaL-like domain-containing protein n=1 Tax=Fusarium sarcochroum TaxID=1208366 RepID=A0A8H4TJB5_9HYPO|nr:hypothetical protein FSARC_10943 [Fusarium sarcochroum]